MFDRVVVVSGMHRTQCTQFEIGRRRHLLIHLQWKISNDTRNIFGKSYKHSILISALAFPPLFDFVFVAERVYDLCGCDAYPYRQMDSHKKAIRFRICSFQLEWELE